MSINQQLATSHLTPHARPASHGDASRRQRRRRGGLLMIVLTGLLVAGCTLPLPAPIAPEQSASDADQIAAPDSQATPATDAATSETGVAALPAPSFTATMTAAITAVVESTAPLIGTLTPEEGSSNETGEARPVSIPLPAPLNVPDAEISAMAWHGDELVLVPQYPQRFGNRLFAIKQRAIVDFLTGVTTELPPLKAIAFDDGGLAETISGFEGYEAIAFDGDQVYMTVETRPGNWMLGYLVSGTYLPDATLIALDPTARTPIPAQAPLTNLTDETLVIDGERLLTIYEANGANVNPDPTATVFDRDLNKLASIPFPTVEFRVTDASAVDEQGRFWVINYFWEGDGEKLRPAEDAIAMGQSQGSSHSQFTTVERLVELQITPDGVVLGDTPPIQLALLPAGIARNWEGIARLQTGELDGFLLATDKFPVTEFAFVPRP